MKKIRSERNLFSGKNISFNESNKSTSLKNISALLNSCLKSFSNKSLTVKVLITTSIITASLVMCFFLSKGVKLWYDNVKDAEITEVVPNNNSVNNSKSSNHEESIKPFIHKTINTEVNGLKQVINILEVYPNTGKIKIRPALSHNSLYGFEFLSEMVERHKAYAGVNGGFFYEYGDPSGMVVIDGDIITASTGEFPVFTIKEGKAELKEQETRLWLKSKNTKTSTKTNPITDSKMNVEMDIKMEFGGINTPGKSATWVLFTRKYGTTNRVNKQNITIIIKDNVVSDIVESNGEMEIPKDGMLATFIKPVESIKSAESKKSIGSITNQTNIKYFENEINDIPFEQGDEVELVYEPDLGSDGQAYECGSWIIKDGKIVIGEHDPWIGVLTNRDPRTAIGIKDRGEVVLITVDGRQPGYSYGFTGQELGEFLLEYGVKYAAMLDGGASTEMIVDNKIVNRPSFKGTERPLAGAIIIEYIN